MAPMWDYRFVERYDHEGVELVALLCDGWQVFALSGGPGDVSRIHLRRPVTGS